MPYGAEYYASMKRNVGSGAAGADTSLPEDSRQSARVLVAITTVAVGGGAEKVATMVANGLSAAGIETMMLTQYADAHEHALTVPRVNLGMALKDFHAMPPWRRVLTKLARAVTRVTGTARACRQHRITTVISFLEESNFYVLGAKLLFRLPTRIIVSVRMDPSRYNPFYKYLIRVLYRYADEVVAVTKGIEETLRSEFKLENVRTIYNPIDIALIESRSREPLPDEWVFLADMPGYYLNIARLTYQKGQWHLLRAFSLLSKKQPDANLVIVGDGDFRERLPQLAEKLGIENRVHFVGRHDNVYPFLRHARSFVFTSLWEGLPNAVLEALALGVPVIAADSTSGMRELIAPDLPLSASVAYPYRTPRGVLVAPFPDEDRATLFEPSDGPYTELAEVMAEEPRAGTISGIKHDFSPESIILKWTELI